MVVPVREPCLWHYCEAPGSGQVGAYGSGISVFVRCTVATYEQLRGLYRVPNISYLFKYVKQLTDSICVGLMTD